VALSELESRELQLSALVSLAFLINDWEVLSARLHLDKCEVDMALVRVSSRLGGLIKFDLELIVNVALIDNICGHQIHDVPVKVAI
jgi:hypothetical protein